MTVILSANKQIKNDFKGEPRNNFCRLGQKVFRSIEFIVSFQYD